MLNLFFAFNFCELLAEFLAGVGGEDFLEPGFLRSLNV
jgi:hypothetical protein